ncbi:hypothetical protein MPLA_190006 [Mesorhizobium sp. ORS 3359]|nr:hypothetical protein MPLA_190006 [Mesorhizobium sp. ORS 3359]
MHAAHPASLWTAGRERQCRQVHNVVTGVLFQSRPVEEIWVAKPAVEPLRPHSRSSLRLRVWRLKAA